MCARGTLAEALLEEDRGKPEGSGGFMHDDGQEDDELERHVSRRRGGTERDAVGHGVDH